MNEEQELRKLHRKISSASDYICHYLRKYGATTRRELEPYVLARINIVRKRDGTIRHVTKLVHFLALIMAYKDLEREGKITIERYDVPFPMTDYRSLFTLVGE